jgi:hypothetical protein
MEHFISSVGRLLFVVPIFLPLQILAVLDIHHPTNTLLDKDRVYMSKQYTRHCMGWLRCQRQLVVDRLFVERPNV